MVLRIRVSRPESTFVVASSGTGTRVSGSAAVADVTAETVTKT
ncbi:hypothetical protein [Halomontanus rarus]